MIDTLSHFLIFFSGCMAWTMSIGQLMERDRKIFHYMFSLFLFCLGVFQFYNGMNLSGMLLRYPGIFFSHLPFLAMIGPAIFFCFKSVLDGNFRLRLVDTIHSIPVISVIILLVPVFNLDEESKKIILSTPPTFRSGNTLVLYYSAVIVSVVLIILSYMFIFMKNTLSIFKIGFIVQRQESTLFRLTMALIYSVVIFYISALIVNSVIKNNQAFYHVFLQYMSVIFFLVVLFIYIIAQRDINYFQTVKKQTEKIRYEQSKIRNLDIDNILVQLSALINDEKIFCDEDISLARLSRELEIEPYQLSQIINENFNKNFSAFINAFRIEEAKKILLEDDGRAIVSVSYAVGFNSPTSFYEWFFKLTGSSPARYRKKALQNANLPAGISPAAKKNINKISDS